jgi:hypothetical protein
VAVVAAQATHVERVACRADSVAITDMCCPSASGAYRDFDWRMLTHHLEYSSNPGWRTHGDDYTQAVM